MTTVEHPGRFTTLPDEETLAATVVALEEHGFSVEVVEDLDAPREAVLARIPAGSSVMINTSITLQETGIAAAVDEGGRYESARNKMMALDFATQLQEMKAIAGQPDFALGSVHAVTRDGTLVVASASGSQLASYVWGATNVIFVVGAQKLVTSAEEAHERIVEHSLPLEDARAYAAYGQNSQIGKILEIHQETRAASTSSSSDSPLASDSLGVGMPEGPVLAPLDEEVDHARGPTAGRVILEYGDYACPYSRQAFRAIEAIEQELNGRIRFAFRHFPLVQIHPHAFGAAAAAEAAAMQDRFWAMHELLFHRQEALQDDDLLQYADQLGLDVARFDQDRVGPDVRRRIRRDVETGLASKKVLGTPTLFIDGVVYVGRYDAAGLTEAFGR